MHRLDSAPGLTPAQLPAEDLLDQLKANPQSLKSLQGAWLGLSQQPSTGDGGPCFGDSGGPHVLGGATSNLLVATTVTGDSQCRAFDKSYRVDTASARAFLGEFVDLP